MPNLIQFHQYLRDVHVIGQTVAKVEPEIAPTPEVDLADLERKAYERGHADAKKEFEAMITAAKTLTGDLLQRLQKADQELTEAVEAALPELVVEGVRRVIPKWSPEPEDVRHIIRELVADLDGDGGSLEIRLNTKDKEHLDQLQGGLGSDLGRLELVADPNLRPGECVVAGRFGMVDGRFESKLNGLRKDLC